MPKKSDFFLILVPKNSLDILEKDEDPRHSAIGVDLFCNKDHALVSNLGFTMWTLKIPKDPELQKCHLYSTKP